MYIEDAQNIYWLVSLLVVNDRTLTYVENMEFVFNGGSFWASEPRPNQDQLQKMQL